MGTRSCRGRETNTGNQEGLARGGCWLARSRGSWRWLWVGGMWGRMFRHGSAGRDRTLQPAVRKQQSPRHAHTPRRHAAKEGQNCFKALPGPKHRARRADFPTWGPQLPFQPHAHTAGAQGKGQVSKWSPFIPSLQTVPAFRGQRSHRPASSGSSGRPGSSPARGPSARFLGTRTGPAPSRTGGRVVCGGRWCLYKGGFHGFYQLFK